MAFVIEGMKCRLCNQPLVREQAITAFSPFVPNEADPLSFFSDGAFHTECFQNHPLASKAEARFREVLDRNKPANRRCVVCGQLITNPDEYCALGNLTEDSFHPMHRFNYAHFHLSCLTDWPEVDRVSRFATEQIESGAWKGRAMQMLVDILKNAGKE